MQYLYYLLFKSLLSNWAGPLFEIGASSDSGTFTFNGNGYKLNGQGASYWDGDGTNGGVTKPVSVTVHTYIVGLLTEYVNLIASHGQNYQRRRNLQGCGMLLSTVPEANLIYCIMIDGSQCGFLLFVSHTIS